TAQIEQLSDQVRQLAGQRRGDVPPPLREAAVPNPRAEPPGPRLPGRQPADPRDGDQIGRLIATDPPRGGPEPALPPTAANAGTAKELYETAYGYLLQQDYGAAEAAFDEFLRRYPSDRLAADAQYWLGETLFVQRRFRPA